MKVTVPAKEVELCDVCRREVAFLDTCLYCGNRYCLTCAAVIAGCIHSVRVCRRCENNETVLAIVSKHATPIKVAIATRDHEIKANARIDQ